MFKQSAITAAATLLIGSSANAALFGVAMSGLYDANGNIPTASMPTVLIIDVDNDGLGLDSWDGSSFLPDSDDLIVFDQNGVKGVWSEATGDNPVGFEALVPSPDKFGVLETPSLYDLDVATIADNTPNVAGGGDDVWLLWFPGLAVDATAPGVGQAFGAVKLGVVPDGFGTLSPNLLSQAQTNPLTAEFTTIPEPTSLALLGLGGLLVARRRRA